MSRALILAQSDITSHALEAIWELVRPESTVDAQHVVADASSDAVSLYAHLADRIEKWLEDGRGEAIVLVDCIDLSRANPLMDSGWHATVAMLILAFPEVRWCFGVCVAKGEEELQKKCSLASIMRVTTDPLFDGDGLRECIRKIARVGSKNTANFLAERKCLSAALDDEPAYAYFHAYTAYRFGFRACPICLDAQAKTLFSYSSDDVQKLPASTSLTFEDICISYPDGPGNVHYSDLDGEDPGSRKKHLPLLDKTNIRVFVTTQHQQVGHVGKNEQNRFYIRSGLCVLNSETQNRCGILMLKPYSGMFDLWRRSKLNKRLQWWDDKSLKFRRGVGEGYVWPPREQFESDGDNGHSAPGRLLMIATHLIKRCEKILPSACSVQEAARCAVLATDALELLGDRTPTTAMDALRLKHVAEVTAECQFSGVEYKIEMKARLKEIQRDAVHIGKWFDRRQQTMAARNAEMTTLVDIIHVLRKHGQFDEIQICQNRIRYLHNRLWMRQARVRYIFMPILAYFEFVLSSFLVFSSMVALWSIVFVLLFHLASVLPVVKVTGVLSDWAPAIKDAIERFITLKEYRAGESLWWYLTATFAAVMSITHMGLFISHLQLILKRKE
jgi:hypothetical protein